MLPQRSWYWQRHPACQIEGQWVTYSLTLLLKAWRQQTDITHRLESNVVWNAVSHQSVSKCDSTNSSCFHSGRGKCCCNAGLAGCVYVYAFPNHKARRDIRKGGTILPYKAKTRIFSKKLSEYFLTSVLPYYAIEMEYWRKLKTTLQWLHWLRLTGEIALAKADTRFFLFSIIKKRVVMLWHFSNWVSFTT